MRARARDDRNRRGTITRSPPPGRPLRHETDHAGVDATTIALVLSPAEQPTIASATRQSPGINGLHITHTTAIALSTSPPLPLFDYIAFDGGYAAAASGPRPKGQNDQAAEMTTVFWIETVEDTIIVPPFQPGQPPLLLKPKRMTETQPAPTFRVQPPIPIPEPRLINVTSTQIQYTQTVLRNFAGLTWPQVSVATLVPASPLPMPPSVWA
jgi:hypothetical protein